MARVAKRKLTDKQLANLFSQLNQTLSNFDSNKTNLFLGELLGPEERIMIAKRLAAIVLLVEGHSLYKTANTLKISSSTAERICNKIQTGELDNLLKLISKDKKNYFTVLQTIDDILHLGGTLPHYNGLDRYKGL